MSYLNLKVYTVAGWIGVAAISVAVIMLAINGNWLGLAVSVLFALASITFLLSRTQFPSLFDLLFILAAVANGAGWVWGLYEDVPGYDEIVHAYTTFAFSLWIGFALYYTRRAHFSYWLFGVAIVSCGLAGGAVWEMLEWTFIKINDPVTDLMMDGIGAVFAGLLATWVLKLEPRRD